MSRRQFPYALAESAECLFSTVDSGMWAWVAMRASGEVRQVSLSAFSALP